MRLADAIYALCNYPSLFNYLQEEGKKEVDGITWEKSDCVSVLFMRKY